MTTFGKQSTPPTNELHDTILILSFVRKIPLLLRLFLHLWLGFCQRDSSLLQGALLAGCCFCGYRGSWNNPTTQITRHKSPLVCPRDQQILHLSHPKWNWEWNCRASSTRCSSGGLKWRSPCKGRGGVNRRDHNTVTVYSGSVRVRRGQTKRPENFH
jgi:hypothetical protein